jgi:16S rRNA (cytosine1402-N4)-methyltransferase
MAHAPVLLNKVLDFLVLEKGEIVFDGTADGGGHSAEMIKRVCPGGKLVSSDEDGNMVESLKTKLSGMGFEEKKDFAVIRGNFSGAKEIISSAGVSEINAAILDLGMSSNQLESSGRGFSFMKEEPLFMTFKWPIVPEDLTARKIVNGYTESDLAEIIRNYGEERFARSIARNIVSARKKKAIETTKDLTDIIANSIPKRFHHGRIHFATRTFQALRIEVNDELNVLRRGLEEVWNILGHGGRFAVISFHSLEDRIVKNFFRAKKDSGDGEILTKKPVIADEEETAANPKSRSAKLRAIRKI